MFDFLDSEDMETLRRAIDACCKDLNIRSDSSEAEMIAREELITRLIAMEWIHWVR